MNPYHRLCDHRIYCHDDSNGDYFCPFRLSVGQLEDLLFEESVACRWIPGAGFDDWFVFTRLCVTIFIYASVSLFMRHFFRLCVVVPGLCVTFPSYASAPV